MTLKELKEILSTLPQEVDNYEVVFGYSCPDMEVQTVEIVDNQVQIGL